VDVKRHRAACCSTSSLVLGLCAPDCMVVSTQGQSVHIMPETTIPFGLLHLAEQLVPCSAPVKHLLDCDSSLIQSPLHPSRSAGLLPITRVGRPDISLSMVRVGDLDSTGRSIRLVMHDGLGITLCMPKVSTGKSTLAAQVTTSPEVEEVQAEAAPRTASAQTLKRQAKKSAPQ
ncbi:hypothetical protein B296_00020806, partial [Ensete ventricosum]